MEDETPPPGYSVSDSVAMSHDLTDLDISLVDHDVQENGNEEGRYPLNEPNDLVLETRYIHTHGAELKLQNASDFYLLSCLSFQK